ncbi:GNAT family N-acetyltransferase [Mangrovihabitans endophyticus]|uniref:N-acetyltransferase n=1 Tax=Mangrovihabitans endophyticus TaxID=1751298 RepID=A0A8J3FPT3_9ACTN|nr:GNAT family N-acetyltransferase [Mangrovihabitans endophyticus]GGL01752.1 N-acetyltransferase [Mangrovihabitans endophyticus]
MITFARLGERDVAPLADDLVNLYEVVYREPPYSEGPEQFDRFRSSLNEDVGRPGFTLIIAVHDGQLVGASYGWTMAAGKWWSRSDTVPENSIKDVDKFAVMEWIVHPRYRGEGTGAQLIRELLTERPEPIATLASDPRSKARGMYARAGWRQVAGTSLSWGPSMDLLVLSLGANADEP